MNQLLETVKAKDLPRSPDFNRLQVLDLILGHEDRHAGNLLFWFEGEERTPENLRFVAIDNGLSLSSPRSKPSRHEYDHRAFQRFYPTPDKDKTLTPQEIEDHRFDVGRAKIDGDEAVAQSLSEIPSDLQEQIKAVDLGEMARHIIGSGINEKGAVRAALVRMAALQENPQIFAQLLKEYSGDLDEAWRQFQYLSGQEDELLKKAGADKRAKEIDAALEEHKPDKWEDPPDYQEFKKHHLQRQRAHHSMWSGGGGGLPKRDTPAGGGLVQRTEKKDRPDSDARTRKTGPVTGGPDPDEEGPDPDAKTRKPKPEEDPDLDWGDLISDSRSVSKQKTKKPETGRQRTERLASLWLSKIMEISAGALFPGRNSADTRYPEYDRDLHDG
jgi:hypothetical protein